jgi:hypothetical protein
MTRLRLREVTIGLLVAGLVILCSSARAAETRPAFTDSAFMIVGFTGDAFVSTSAQNYSSSSAAAFWDGSGVLLDATLPKDIIVKILAGNVDLASGFATGRYSDQFGSCSGGHELTQQLHPGTATASGVRYWTSGDRGVYPDPGGGKVLVTADPFWPDYAQTSGGCQDHAEPRQIGQDLEGLFSKPASCVVEAVGGTCQRLLRLPTTMRNCGSSTYKCVETLKGYYEMSVTSLPSTDYVPDLVPALDKLIELYTFPFAPSIPLRWPLLPPFDDLPRLSKGKAKVPEDGEADGQLKLGGKVVVTTKTRLSKGVATALRLSWGRAGVDAVRGVTKPTELTGTFTFVPAKGPPFSLPLAFYLAPPLKGGTAPTPTPPSSAGTITSVAFAGGPANPTVVVHGKYLGKLPAPNPAGHPSGLNGCPVVANDTGYDYGTSLYIAVPSGNFAGGRYRPSLNETDCLDLVVTKFTPTEVDFHFGPFYTTYYPKFALAAGSQAIVVVNGATANVNVKYG